MKTPLFFILAAIIVFVATSGQAQPKFNPTYKLDRIVYKISDNKIREAVQAEKEKTSFKKGQSLDRQTFNNERERIEKLVKLKVDTGFDKSQIKFEIDTSSGNNLFSVVTVIAKNN